MSVLKDVDEVIHLAHSTTPKTSSEDPAKDILSNLPASVTLFEAASSLPIRKLVLVSSGGTVYGVTQTSPIAEEHCKNPISSHGIVKSATEDFAMMFHRERHLPVICVRPGNAYGQGQRPFAGQGFVATAIGSIFKRQEIVIFGQEGTIRDYIYVTDVASGIVASLERGTIGSTYNIGTGIGKSNMDVIATIAQFAKAAGFDPKVRIAPARPFDVPINILDSRKLRDETSWRPAVPFEEGIGRTWNWFCRGEGRQY
jgi:UDP-glucose 4-epimerase